MKELVFLVTTGTATAAPTAAVPLAEILPAMTLRLRVSPAATRTLPPARRTAPLARLVPSATLATVVTLMTGTSALTLTAAVPAKPPPTDSAMIFSEEVASTEVLPVVRRLPPLPIEAVVVLLITSTSTPAPTPAVPPMVIWPASERILPVSVAAIAAAVVVPVATSPTWTLSSTWAVTVSVSRSTTTEPATPTSPPPAPPTAMIVRPRFSDAVTASPVPPACRSALWPIPASTRMFRSRIVAAAPTPASLPIAIWPAASVSDDESSVALTVSAPPARAIVLEPMEARVPVPPPEFSSNTRMDPVTPAPSAETPPPRTSSNSVSVVLAWTDRAPPVLTCAELPMLAPTVLLRTSTTIATATPALPLVSESAPETLVIVVASVEVTAKV